MKCIKKICLTDNKNHPCTEHNIKRVMWRRETGLSPPVKYCYALPVSQMSCSLASICIDDPRTLTSVCDCGSRGHTVS